SVSASRSAGSRTSPWTNSTPASRSRARFSSAPRRRRLSRATSRQSGCRSASVTATLAPTNPAPPVTSTRTVQGYSAGQPASPRHVLESARAVALRVVRGRIPDLSTVQASRAVSQAREQDPASGPNGDAAGSGPQARGTRSRRRRRDLLPRGDRAHGRRRDPHPGRVLLDDPLLGLLGRAPERGGRLRREARPAGARRAAQRAPDPALPPAVHRRLHVLRRPLRLPPGDHLRVVRAARARARVAGRASLERPGRRPRLLRGGSRSGPEPARARQPHGALPDRLRAGVRVLRRGDRAGRVLASLGAGPARRPARTGARRDRRP